MGQSIGIAGSTPSIGKKDMPAAIAPPACRKISAGHGRGSIVNGGFDQFP